MEDLSLHILDIAENSVEAQADEIRIRLEENRQKDRLTLEIADNGKGMDKELLERALDPFVTTKKARRIGLGLPLLTEAAKAAGGTLTVRSQPGRGTKVRATFQLSHIDLKPLGDLTLTLLTLIAGHPDIDIRYTHAVNGKKYAFDTRDLRAQLHGIPINDPQVIKFIKHDINEGIDQIRRKT
jgi:anti-sigma regulatory factor (Ser/Thr protein kinase)